MERRISWPILLHIKGKKMPKCVLYIHLEEIPDISEVVSKPPCFNLRFCYKINLLKSCMSLCFDLKLKEHCNSFYFANIPKINIFTYKAFRKIHSCLQSQHMHHAGSNSVSQAAVLPLTLFSSCVLSATWGPVKKRLQSFVQTGVPARAMLPAKECNKSYLPSNTPRYYRHFISVIKEKSKLLRGSTCLPLLR